MAAPRSASLDPALLAVAQRLNLTARQLVADAVTGQHPSRRPGIAREFSQYRAYQPGDEPRQIDWKLFARSDRYYIRESEVTTRLAISLVLDATASMQHRGADAPAPPKLDCATALAAAFACLAERQGDPCALHLVSDGQVRSVLTAGQRQPLPRILNALAAVTAKGRWPADPRVLTQALQRAEMTGASVGPGATAHLTVVLTDGHEPGGEIRASLAPLRARRHELLLVHFIAPDERDFPYRGTVRFEEWETGLAVTADAAAVRAAFLAAGEREQDAWRRGWGDRAFDYLPLATDEPLAPGLRRCLLRRSGR
jgi:uncharacterized protein (DUF58 family)